VLCVPSAFQLIFLCIFLVLHNLSVLYFCFKYFIHLKMHDFIEFTKNHYYLCCVDYLNVASVFVCKIRQIFFVAIACHKCAMVVNKFFMK